ncbi:MAG: hypothetical protein J6V25_04470 [Oscillospiraceae bacterium]|nr:hypothetical protein [Oscillospiraceae bacterium]
MKKIIFAFLPILIIVAGASIVPGLLSSGIDPKLLVVISIGLVSVLYAMRPKKAAPKSVQQIIDEVLDDYSKDAFASDAALDKSFRATLSDIGNNLPKTALNKLKKLELNCTENPQKYAVAMASAKCYQLSKDFKNVIREYNKAIVLHPTDLLAYRIGDCHQRLGALEKARDSYEFAAELDPNNPQYPSSIGTVCVGEGNYDAAMDYAMDALVIDENFSQALATMAICHGVKRNSAMCDHYTAQAVANGYSQEKIESTIKALIKRDSN